MQEYILIKNGAEETRRIKTSWDEVTLSEYVSIMTQETQLGSACKLCDLSLEEYAASGIDMDVYLLYALEMIKEGPQSVRPSWLPSDLGNESIGKFELCRKYLRRATQSHLQAYPYLYAIYAYPQEYDALESMINEFPTELFWRAAKLPITEVFAVCDHIMADLERVSEKYASILQADHTAEQVAAGIDRFEKYGSFPTLLSSAAGDLTQLERVLKIKSDVFFYSLCVQTEKSEYELAYHELRSSQRQ